MACDNEAQIIADIADLEQQIRDLQAALVSQAVATASGTSTQQGGREFKLTGPKGGAVEFKEGDKAAAGGASAASSVRLLDHLKECLAAKRKELARCRRGGKAAKPRLGGIDTRRRQTGTGCNDC